MNDASQHPARRWVATLIMLLLLLRLGNWAWQAYFRQQRSRAAASELHRKVLASRAYDNALLRANALLDQGQTATATQLLDSLRRQPADSVFAIEKQKLRATQRRLDSVQRSATKQ